MADQTTNPARVLIACLLCSGSMDTPNHRSLAQQRGAIDRRWLLAALALVLLGLAALWRLSPLGQDLTAEQVASGLEQLQQSRWAIPALAVIYVLGNAVLFPTLLLNIGVILVWGAVWGSVYALGGSVLAGLLFFAVGQRWGAPYLERWQGRRLKASLRFLRASGVVGMVILRVTPVAPYPIVNLALGAAEISWWVFGLGTLLGLLPSILGMAVVGEELRALMQDPQPEQLMQVAALAVVVLGVLAAVQWLARRYQREHSA